MSDTVETVEQVEPEVQKPDETLRAMRRTKPQIRDSEDAILELRKENEKLRKTLEEQASARAEELANQKLEALRSETEAKATERAEKLLEKRLSELSEANKGRLIKAELRAQAERVGVIDFDDLYDALKRSTLKDVTVTDDGEVANAAEIIAELKQRKAHLFQPMSTSSSERAPVGRVPDNVEKIALSMSDEEFARSLNRLIGKA